MAAVPNVLVTDPRGLDGLRTRAASDPRGAVREAAKAFETLFMQELLKSMRASTMPSGLTEGEGSKLGTEMLDQQLAARMSGLPGGLSEVIARQLERQMGLAPGPIPRTARANPEPAPLRPAGDPAAAVRVPQTAAASFVSRHTATAERVAASTGIPAAFMVSQAALETGWGRKEILHANGSTSHNLFGIKAGPNWKGPVAEVWTTEYVNGQPQRVRAEFRAYSSYEESFADYARLLQDSPRYASVMASRGNAAAFAANLQKAGYATDPAYADKLGRVINTTLRLQRALA